MAALCVIGLVAFGCWSLNTRTTTGDGPELLVTPAIAAAPRNDAGDAQASLSASIIGAAAVQDAPLDVALAEPLPSEVVTTVPSGVITGGVPPVEAWRQAARVEAEPIAGSALPAEVVTESVATPRPRLYRASLRADPASSANRRPVPASFAAALQGTWAPQADACLDPAQSEFIPLVISKAKATAGDGTCAFMSKKRDGRKWSVVADCSDGQSNWTSHIDLAVEGSVLTWASERGQQSYVRCQPTVVAKAAVKQRIASRQTAKRVARAAPRKSPAVRVVYGPGGATPGVAVTHVR